MGAPCKNRRAGFTLLEIIVSITLLVLIALMLSRVFNESTKAVTRGTNHVLLDETARLLLDAFEQDISQALIRTNIAFESTTDSKGGSLYYISTGTENDQGTPLRVMSPKRISAPDAGGEFTKARYIAMGKITDSGQAISLTPYTPVLSNSQEDHAVVTFLDFMVNGNPDWQSQHTAISDTTSLPRFVDVSIGLITAKDIKAAIQGNSAEQINNNEQIYTRRIYLRNRGIGELTF